jgi:hypothetical protein
MKGRTSFAMATFVAVFTSVMASVSAAEPSSSSDLPPPPKPQGVTADKMEIAFASVPLNCRVEVQRQLRAYGYYDGEIDGQWSFQIAKAVADYAGGLQTVAYGWSSVAGSKGILWHIGFSEDECPMPPYTS